MAILSGVTICIIVGNEEDAMHKFCSIVLDNKKNEAEIPVITFMQSAKECYELSKKLSPESETYIEALEVGTTISFNFFSNSIR